MKKSTVGSSTLLLLTACIWGVAFAAQSMGNEFIGPFTFNCIRFFLGGIVLLPVIIIMHKHKRAAEGSCCGKKVKKAFKRTVWAGICCGTVLCMASLCQQYGISFTTVGKAGFITALYIIIIPIMGIFLKKKISIKIWISAGIAVLGLYLLCVKESFTVNKGDMLILFCSFLFSVHILLIDHFAEQTEGIVLSCVQFFTSALISGAGMLLFEKPELKGIADAYIPVLYAGIMSCGVAYTLQVIGQKGTAPAVASLILSLESVVAALAGWLLLGQILSVNEILGCILVFAAILLAQLPNRKIIENNIE